MESFRYPLDDIRARCDVVEIVSPHVALKRSGKNLKGLCPFHAEKTPSFVAGTGEGLPAVPPYYSPDLSGYSYCGYSPDRSGRYPRI